MTEASPAPTPTPAAAPAPTPTPAPTPAPAATPAPTPTPAPGAQEWMAGLPDDLLNDPTLTKYGSLADQLRGHLEAHKTAKSKAVPLPGDTEESRKAFADALRPESVEAYDFGELPEHLDKDLVEGFRQHAFETGKAPYQAKADLDFYAGAMAKSIEAANEASQKDVDSFKAEYGSGYDAKLAEVQQMIEGFTGTPLELGDGELNALDMKLGSGKLMKFMFALHDRVGDLAPAGEGDLPAGMQRVAPENAEATLDAKMKDAEWRKKALVKGSPEQRESEHLQKMMAQHRVSRKTG